MRPTDCPYDVLTLMLARPKGALEQVCLVLCHQAKNLFNTANFLIRQVTSAYQYDAQAKVNRLRPELQANQAAVIAHINAQIVSINAARKARHPEKVAKATSLNKEAPDLKLIPTLDAVMPKLAGTLLDATLLDNAARNWQSHDGDAVYKRLPAVMSQQVIGRLRDAYSSFFEALKVYAVAPATLTGRPRMPGYLPKHERFVIELPIAAISVKRGMEADGDKPATPDRGYLPSLKGKTIPVDYAETSVLDDETMAAFSAFDLVGAVNTACHKRGWKDGCTPQHVRIVPRRTGVKMEAVVRVPNAYPANSFLARLVQDHGPALAELTKEKERDKWIVNYLKDLPAKVLPRFAAIDLGTNNIATVAYSTGHQAAVHTGGHFDAVMATMNEVIDRFVSENTPLRARELQGKKNALRKEKHTLTKAEHRELGALLKPIYEEPRYQDLTARREVWKEQYLHRLSRGIVRHCADRGIEVIVIGKNARWKDEVDMGRQQNRRFCQIAHARLIEFIRYKAQLLGMAVVTVEESYTSRTSFVANETLACYGEKTPMAVPADSLTSLSSASPDVAPVTLATSCGKRSSNRHWFVHSQPRECLQRVHSDVNGAMNIGRKLFAQFAWHARLSLKFVLWRLSERCGVVPVQLQ
ncbi:MAG: IS200/IS605 family element transposase accessory protein TnpB [Herminiimonas sp.]|nr:IS200/IS605 family element transposase accessory protein TnpB [Herminiimonas sp.]